VAEGGGLLRPPGITERAGIFEISARFFLGNLVGVGWRMIGSGPRLGTLLGTLGHPNLERDSGQRIFVVQDGAPKGQAGVGPWARKNQRLATSVADR
jgi:hypothetical protein